MQKQKGERIMENEKHEAVKTESASVPAKKINGDLRTFVIALLTAIIVALIHHGIMMFCCPAAGKDCPQKEQCESKNFRPAPPEFRKERPDFNFRQHHHGRKFNRRPRAEKQEDNNGNQAVQEQTSGQTSENAPTSGQEK